MEHGHRHNWCSYRKWCLSILMLVHQRVIVIMPYGYIIVVVIYGYWMGYGWTVVSNDYGHFLYVFWILIYAYLCCQSYKFCSWQLVKNNNSNVVNMLVFIHLLVNRPTILACFAVLIWSNSNWLIWSCVIWLLRLMDYIESNPFL